VFIKKLQTVSASQTHWWLIMHLEVVKQKTIRTLWTKKPVIMLQPVNGFMHQACFRGRISLGGKIKCTISKEQKLWGCVTDCVRHSSYLFTNHRSTGLHSFPQIMLCDSRHSWHSPCRTQTCTLRRSLFEFLS